MQVRVLKRRECGAGWATDLLLPRCLTWPEVEKLAKEMGGTCRCFQGQLVWLDLPAGRITASLRLPRLTMRLYDAAVEAQILSSLQQLVKSGDPGIQGS
ncbi:hypothetical protein [Synechococcus sp. O70.1]|jgi:hypothetical protein|uniref:hypothetical protein n=1 Tax=Synechococcus sp. O70.1 TaxID=2964535 RepID=UPI0039C192D9